MRAEAPRAGTEEQDETLVDRGLPRLASNLST